MSQTLLDETTGDLIRENGTSVRVTGKEEIAQHLRVKLRLIQGEIPLDLTKGIRLFSETPGDGAVFAKGTKVEDIGGEYRGEALDTPGIISVDRMDLTQTDEQRAARDLSIEMEGTYSLTDAAERIPFHDKITVGTGGFGG